MAISDNILKTRSVKANGHFGEWMQGRLGETDRIALISVQCPHFWVRANFTDAVELRYDDSLPSLPRDKLVELLLALNNLPLGRFVVDSNMQFGAGLGASTASLLAIARVAAKSDASLAFLSQAILSVEGASDPIMYPDFDQLLWASREAKILDKYASPPPFEVLGALWGNPQRTDPSDRNFPDISDLIPIWRDATQAQDHDRVASLSTESFKRTSDLRGSGSDPSTTIAKDLGALGVIRAHTGSARGFLFKPGGAPQSGLNLLAEAGYSDAGTFKTGAHS